MLALATGVALAIGLSLVAVAIAHAGRRSPPPLLLSAAWSAAAAISFSASLAYLLVRPRIRRLLQISVMTALALLFSLVVLLVRNG